MTQPFPPSPEQPNDGHGEPGAAPAAPGSAPPPPPPPPPPGFAPPPGSGAPGSPVPVPGAPGYPASAAGAPGYPPPPPGPSAPPPPGYVPGAPGYGAPGYGAQPGFVPPPPSKPRGGFKRFLGPIILVVVAIVVGIVLAATLLPKFFETDATVPLDGVEHVITLDSTDERVVWVRDFDRPTCEFRAATTGHVIELEGISETLTRNEFQAVRRFTPPTDGKVAVTCQGSGDRIEIGPYYGVSQLGGAILAMIGIPGFLVFVAIVWLVVVLVRKKKT